MQTIKQILMSRDGLSEFEADDLIAQAQAAIDELLDEGVDVPAQALLDAEQIIQDYFSLEPDYLMELIS